MKKFNNRHHGVLFELLRSENHKDIIDIIDDVSEGYVKTEGKKWTLYTPLYYCCDYLPLMASHTDTVSDKKPKYINMSEDGVLTNKNGVLGADDRAGCYGLYEMMKKKVDAFYLFTDEEEVGGVGAGEFAISEEFESIKEYVSTLIELDRRGHEDCALYGYDNDKMLELFMNRGYKEAGGSYTDVVDLAGESGIACVNLSVGYYNEHTQVESLNVNEMNRTIDIMINDMPEEFYTEQFLVEEKSYNDYYDWKYELVEESYKPELCSICGGHEPLYEAGGELSCMECLQDDWA